MSDYNRLYRLLQLIARLRQPLGCDKHKTAEDFGVSVRSIERYLHLLEEVGFVVKSENKRYSIATANKQPFRSEDHILFTLDEARCLSDVLVNIKTNNPLHFSILEKLYTLTELDDISQTIQEGNISGNITNIRKAIHDRKQVVLIDYHSLNSNKVSNRLIEPVKFIQTYRYLLAWDVDRQANRQFRTSRISDVRIKETPWAHAAQHQHTPVDLFGMAGEHRYDVHLVMSKRAKHLLTEEFPGAAASIARKAGGYHFKSEVYSLEGIGRFVLGLPGEILIKSPDALNDYIIEKLSRYQVVDVKK